MSSGDDSAKEIDNPFPGPQPYRAADRARFHGRDEWSQDLSDAIIAHRCVALYGPSGAGKSSLMQAAVIPRLAEVYEFRHVTVDGWPTGETPVAWLMDAILSQLKIAAPQGELGIDESVAWTITRAFRRSDRPILLYLDQIEQLLFPGRAGPEVDDFLDWLDRFAERPLRGLHLVLAMREDYFGRFRDRARGRHRLLEHGFLLGPLTVGELVTAVCLAALDGTPSQTWSREATYDVMLQVRAPGQSESEGAEIQAAFAQIVCRALFAERAERVLQGVSPLTKESIHAEPILQQYLESTLTGLGALRGAAERFLESHLVAGDGSRALLTEEAARASGVLNDDDLNTVLTRLEKAAVLRAEEHRGSRYFELGHDWLARKVFERKQERLDRAAAESREREREAQQRAAEEALRRARAEARRARRVAAVVTAFGLIAMVLGIVAWTQREEALAARRESDHQRAEAEAAQATAERAQSTAETAQAAAEAAQTAAETAQAQSKVAKTQAEKNQKENERSVRHMFEVALRTLTERMIKQRRSFGVVEVDGRWTPLLARGDRALVAASLGQDFRAVVVGHESVLIETDGDRRSVFLEVCVSWLLGDQARRKIAILTRQPDRYRELAVLEHNLMRLSYQVVTYTSLVPDATLSDVGVLILDNRQEPHFSDDEQRVIEAFIQGGGGVLAIGHGRTWLDERVSERLTQTLADYPMNTPLAERGARWSDDEVSPKELGQREVPAIVRFKNTLDDEVNIYTHDSGKEEYYTTLAARESRELLTSLGSVWISRMTSDGRPLGTVEIADEDQIVSISDKVVKTSVVKSPTANPRIDPRLDRMREKLSSNDMKAGLAQAAQAAYSCGRQLRTLMDEATVLVRIGADGRVTGVTVQAPAKGTPEAHCIVSAVLNLQFPVSREGGSTTWALKLY